MPLTRRRLLSACGAAASAAALAACARPAGGPSSVAAARPAVAVPTIALSFEPLNSGLWSAQGSKIVHDALWQTLEPWRQAHPKVNLNMLPFGGDTGATQIISGTAPDVILAWQNFGSLGYADLLLDLTPYVRASNSDLSVWPSYAVDGYRINGRLYALPFYVATTSMALNLAVLDDLGLPYPDPQATWDEWARLWQATYQPQKRVGGSIKWSADGMPQAYFYGWGGSIVDPAVPTRCTMDSTAALNAANAVFPLLQEGVCTFRYGNGVMLDFAAGKYASTVIWNAGLAVTSWVVALAQMPKMDFYLMPTMPHGTFAHTQYDYRAVSATTKQPELAWELLEWLSFQPDFQRTLMKYGLEPPALKSLQEEYITIMAEVVPPFRKKNLSVITYYVTNDRAIMEPIFPVMESQVYSLMQTTERAIAARKTGITVGMRQLTNQVNAMLTAGMQEETRQTAISHAFPTKGPAVAPVPAGI